MALGSLLSTMLFAPNAERWHIRQVQLSKLQNNTILSHGKSCALYLKVGIPLTPTSGTLSNSFLQKQTENVPLFLSLNSENQLEKGQKVNEDRKTGKHMHYRLFSIQHL